jgi:hypothetical protein
MPPGAGGNNNNGGNNNKGGDNNNGGGHEENKGPKRPRPSHDRPEGPSKGPGPKFHKPSDKEDNNHEGDHGEHTCYLQPACHLQLWSMPQVAEA